MKLLVNIFRIGFRRKTGYIGSFEKIISYNIDKFFILPIVVLFPISIYSIILTQIEMFSCKLSFTSDGLHFYLDSFSDFKGLFTSTLMICTAYWGILSLKQKIKQDELREWKDSLNERLNIIKERDFVMYREIDRMKKNLFNDLYDRKFHLNNKKQVREFFTSHFAPTIIGHFETGHDCYKKYEKTYPDENYSFSVKDFKFVFYAMCPCSKMAMAHLEELYIEGMKDCKNFYRIIDLDKFDKIKKICTDNVYTK
ncbi:MAG: hypothetical protein Q8861_07700 [Bacteroidota bacterium]|nr:hypothetical protein [Bacteroidota bacterium]